MTLRRCSSLVLLLATGAAAHAADEPDVNDVPLTFNPVMDSRPLLERELTPEERHAWVTHPSPIEVYRAAADAPRPEARPLQMSPYFATGPVGDIYVVEGSNNLVLSRTAQYQPCTGSGCYLTLNPRGGMEAIMNAVLSAQGDHYDQIVVWTTFDDVFASAFYAPLKNDTRGLGVCENTGSQDAIFGCLFNQSPGRVQGLIYMNRPNMWVEVDRQWGVNYSELDFGSQVYATLGQESAHRWLCGFHVREAGGRSTNKLLGRDKSHWNLKLDAQASVMDGMDWEDRGGGRFAIIADNDGYSDLDLYGMGFIGPEEVPSFFFVENAYSTYLRQIYSQLGVTFDGYLPNATSDLKDPNDPNSAVLPYGMPPHEVVGDITATGSKVEFTMQDVIAASGTRQPDVTISPKVFNQAWVLVTRPGQTSSEVAPELAQLEAIRQVWEAWFAEKTRGRGSVCTALSGVCLPPQAEIVDVRFSDANGDNDGEWSRGEAVELFVILANYGTRDIASTTATATVNTPGVETQVADTTIANLLRNQTLESPTPIRLNLPADFTCDTNEIAVNISVPAAQGGTQSRDFVFVVKPCTGQGGSSGFGPFPAPGVGCGCLGSSPADLAGDVALAGGLALLLQRRRRR